MRVLILDQAIPFPPVGGGALRTYHLARALAVRHEVTVAGFSFGEAQPRPPFPVQVVACPWDWPPLYKEMRQGEAASAQAAAEQLAHESGEPWFVSWAASADMEGTLRGLAKVGFDLVVVEHTCMARFLPALPPGLPVVLDLHNVHSLMARRALEKKTGAEKEAALREAERTLRFEKEAASRCALCLAVSDEEAEAARTLLGVAAVRVIPNGVDTSFFSPSDGPVVGGSLLYTGMMDYGPNVEAVRYFATDVLPLVRREVPEARFHVVGANPGKEVTELTSGYVEVHGYVPDVRPYYRDAAVVVVPLLHGGGTRLKVLEAAASGKAVVSTSLGVEGLKFRPGEDLLVADSPGEFADAVVRLCRDEVRRQRMGRQARCVSQRYEWEVIGSHFCHLLEKLVRRREAPQQDTKGARPGGRVEGRFFLVGCPRSGTTLLQSLLAAHPLIASFPESHFFPYLVPDDEQERAAGRASWEARGRWDRFLEEIGRPEMGRLLPDTAGLIPEYVEAFVRLLDTLTLERGKDRWLEKTPDHLRYVDEIERYIPDTRFIHLLRDGRDVVASLYEVTHQYPKVWQEAWSIDRCIQKWNEDIARSRAHLQKPNHFAVRYERLVEHPEAVLRETCAFLGVTFCPEMVEQRVRVAPSLIRNDEVWKHRVTAGIGKAPARKFDTLFDAEQRAYIRGRLTTLELPGPANDEKGMTPWGGEGGVACS